MLVQKFVVAPYGNRAKEVHLRALGSIAMTAAIVREVARLHGGTARIDDGPDGRRLAVTLRLPAAAAAGPPQPDGPQP